VERKTTRPRLVRAMMDIWALPDLRRRILFTIGMLVVFRFISHVPLPGVNLTNLRAYFGTNSLLGMLNLFTGGAMERFSVAALGVYPYITASIIMQLLVPVIPSLQSLSQEGELGQQRINRITHLATIPLAALQSYAMIALLRSQSTQANPLFTGSLGPLTIANIIITMIASTMFLVWLGELITERGVGNGISMIIFGGIVVDLPQIVGRGYVVAQGENPGGLVAYIILTLVMILLIVVFIEAHRRIPVQYARSTFRSGRMYRQSGATYVPLRVNTAGMIPLIFAIALMQLPGTIATYFMNPSTAPPNFWNTIYNVFQSSTGIYQVLYFVLVVGFTLFYTMVIFEQMNLPQTLQQQGGFIPGVRPGKATADYLNGIIIRITFGGALFLAVVAILPFIAQKISTVDLAIRSTAMLIAVGVALDTMKQLEAQLTMRRYEGFLK
jgi:preprotein translocase subunit SecY